MGGHLLLLVLGAAAPTNASVGVTRIEPADAPADKYRLSHVIALEASCTRGREDCRAGMAYSKHSVLARFQGVAVRDQRRTMPGCRSRGPCLACPSSPESVNPGSRHRHAPPTVAASPLTRHGEPGSPTRPRAGQAQLPWQGTDLGRPCAGLRLHSPAWLSPRRRRPPRWDREVALATGGLPQNHGVPPAIPKRYFPAPIAGNRSKPPRAAMSARAGPFLIPRARQQCGT
jgi:hypothetical protein